MPLEEGNSFCECSITVCKQHCLLWFCVCDVCWPSAGRTPAGDCGELRTEPACHPYLTDYVDIHSVMSNTRDGDHGDYGTGWTSEGSCFCSWQYRKMFLFSISLGQFWAQAVAYWLRTGVKAACPCSRPLTSKNVDLQVNWSASMVEKFHSCHVTITADYDWCRVHTSTATSHN